ncbi:MAG TPA: ABC transporter ATP-binding protein [Sedimentisphaerales bacterium]|nr:ABC transporter ATP-binding protein [Sedimentisphaerales bacterium]HRS10191.1 ABC transporter ATP-binding protein [Sedimentisphaerales bacterium]HRV46897.1 ABC transporter ATP-binding protein [Sedimentisphaerales bacterium]
MLVPTCEKPACEWGVPPMVVECAGLTKVFRRPFASLDKAVYALREVSLSVRKGQIVGLIGPNGAGKSTLLNLIAGLILPTQGRVTVCGHPARSVGARHYLGFMPEHPVFPGLYSARAVLRYHGALLGLARDGIARQVDKSIEQLHMEEFADRPASDFSQGMKQRLALAIAMMSDPQLLLLDEPSNGLDPIGIIELRDLLQQLRGRGTSVVISSHRLGELEKLTNDYIFMHRGRIVQFGDELNASQAGQLHVGVVSNGEALARSTLPASKVLGASDKEMMIAIGDADEVPGIVSDLVTNGARITSVVLKREDIEDVFLRLCGEGNGQ